MKDPWALAPHGLPGVVILTGKGGVGTTTVTAVMALGAFRAGLRVLVADLGGSDRWERLIPGVEVRHLRARDLLEEYLVDRRMGVIARRLRSSGVLEVVATAAPGIEELVVLGKIKQLERSGAFDLILVDAPASGQALAMLTSPSGVAEAVTTGPLRTQAVEVLEMVGDPARCMVMLVTLAEDTPITETIETAFALEERVGAQLGPVVVNRVEPPDHDGAEVDSSTLATTDPALGEVVAAIAYRQHRARAHAQRSARLAEALPLAQIHLAEVPTAHLDAGDIAALAAPLVDQIAAAAVRREDQGHEL